MTVGHQCRALFGMLGGFPSLSGAMIRDRVMGKRCPTLYAACGVGLRDVRDGSVTVRARVGWRGERPASYYPTRVENGAMRCIECDAADVSERRERTTGVTDAPGAAPVVSSSMNAAVEFSIALNIHPTSSHS